MSLDDRVKQIKHNHENNQSKFKDIDISVKSIAEKYNHSSNKRYSKDLNMDR